MATAASRTTNPLLLALILAAVWLVVSARRSDAPWAQGFSAYVYMGLVVVAIRVVFRVLLDGGTGAHVLFTLPELSLPAAAAGIRIGGPVTLEGVLAAVYDGLRLATLLICVGAANVLANPKRLLRVLPSALHEVGVAVTVALSVAPQLVESGRRIRRARRLRGEQRPHRRLLATVVLPVLTDALDRSLLLAASMDARGYGRTTAVPRSLRAATGALVLGGLVGVCVGTYGLLDAESPRWVGIPLLVVGTATAATGLVVGGRRVQRSRYRPDVWRVAEWAVVGSGLVAAAVFVSASLSDPSVLHPSLAPLAWPALPPVPSLAVAVGALPAWVAPPTPSFVVRAPERARAAPGPAQAPAEAVVAT